MSRHVLPPAGLLGLVLFLAPPSSASESGTEPVLDLGTRNAVDAIAVLDQGWSDEERLEYYYRPQGSRIVPYSWMLALHEAGTDLPFARDELILRNGYLPGTQDPKWNPDGLPLGFVKDGRNDWVGLSCGACHTGQLNYEGVGYRVDGGASNGDYEGILTDLLAALDSLDDPGRFDGFARRVLGKKYSEKRKAKLLEELGPNREYVRNYVLATETAVTGGYARVDALGGAFNHLLVNVAGLKDELRPLTSPVSYMHIWDAARHDRTQWNGFNHNGGYGRVARNVGQVTGVWSHIDFKPGMKTTTYPSSVRVPGMIETERLNRSLTSPAWPEAFGALDGKKVAAGAALYAEHCVECHEVFDRADPEREARAVIVPLDDIGTDPEMATTFATRTTKTGAFEGRRVGFGQGTFGAEAKAYEVLVHSIIGIMQAQPMAATEELLIAIADGRGTPGGAPIFASEEELKAYRARTLNGIWATPPFLHNGSVPTLFDLLLPPEERPKEFWVGDLTFDPVKVGYATAAFEGGFRFDTTLESNWNTGHVYGAELSDDERYAIIEYIKSL
ncbi:MAG: hypothetical protein KDA24_06235 [Deltaproteobacteria bacterium]|nr:hypothetical protein [Deltaproteobacteria bacterium]